MTGVFKRERKGIFGHRKTKRAGGHVQMETETGLMPLPAKECQEPIELGRGRVFP